MLLSLKKTKTKNKRNKLQKKANKTNKPQQNKHKKQQNITVLVYITGGDAIRQLL